MATFKANHYRRGDFREGLVKFIWPVVVVLLGVGLLLFHEHFLKVASVDCQTDASACPQAIRNLASDYLGQSFLFLRQRDLAGRISATGLVDQVKITIQLPGRLIIRATPPGVSFNLVAILGTNPPQLAISDATNSAQVAPPSIELASYVATTSGQTFRLLGSGVLDQSAVPTTSYLIAPTVPDRAYLAIAFTWLTALGRAKLIPEAIYFLPQLLVVKIKDQPDYLFNLMANPDSTLLALQRLVNAVTITKLRVIDFRYTNPILK